MRNYRGITNASGFGINREADGFSGIGPDSRGRTMEKNNASKLDATS
jgi:hypothetical protein